MGGILTGGYQIVTGASGLFGGSPGRRAADEEHQSKRAAADVGELEAAQTGAFEAGQVRVQGSRLVAKQKTAYTASGVDTSEGTPASVMADTRMMTERDARMAENNAARKVRGFKEQRTQAGEEHRRRMSEEEQKAIGSILGGIGNIAGSAGKTGI